MEQGRDFTTRVIGRAGSQQIQPGEDCSRSRRARGPDEPPERERGSSPHQRSAPSAGGGTSPSPWAAHSAQATCRSARGLTHSTGARARTRYRLRVFPSLQPHTLSGYWSPHNAQEVVSRNEESGFILSLFFIQIFYCRHWLVSQFSMANTQKLK